MPVIPAPGVAQLPAMGAPDLWSNASFYDVTLVKITEGIIASGAYAPGPLIMQIALAATAELMYQTGRWIRPAGSNPINITPEEGVAVLRSMRPKGT